MENTRQEMERSEYFYKYESMIVSIGTKDDWLAVFVSHISVKGLRYSRISIYWTLLIRMVGYYFYSNVRLSEPYRLVKENR